MSELSLMLAALFLPVFPLSMVFNKLFNATHNILLRSVLLLAWPHLGLLLIKTSGVTVPTWMLVVAVATSLLYSIRLLALRDVGQWISFLATSVWALLWLTLHATDNLQHIHLQTFAATAPLLLLALLCDGLEKRFGAAYTGIYGGLAQSIPRFAGVFVVVVLAAVATPLFPEFFVMLKMIIQTSALLPGVAATLLGIWLLWSWAAARLLQGLIVGPAATGDVADLHMLTTWAYVLALIIMMLGSVYLSGDLL